MAFGKMLDGCNPRTRDHFGLWDLPIVRDKCFNLGPKKMPQITKMAVSCTILCIQF